MIATSDGSGDGAIDESGLPVFPSMTVLDGSKVDANPLGGLVGTGVSMSLFG